MSKHTDDLQTVLHRVASIREGAAYVKPDIDMQHLLILADSHAELLEAMKTLLDAVNGNHVTVGDCNQASAAIFKATGEAS